MVQPQAAKHNVEAAAGVIEVQIGSAVFHFLEITWYKMSAGRGLC